jgi:galactokinase
MPGTMADVTQSARGVEPVWSVAWSPQEGADRARELFRGTFDREAHSVRSAPGRITVIGEHTDYSKGLALATVLDHSTFVAAAPRSDDLIRVVSGQFPHPDGVDPPWQVELAAANPGSLDGWPAYVIGTLWALRERGYVGAGLDIAIEGCVPARAGLSASASLTGAVALAANDVWGLAMDSAAGRAEFAEACIDAEAQFVGVPTAGLDQHTVLRCTRGEGVRIDFRESPPRAPSHPLYFPDYGLGLLVINTRQLHDRTDGEYARRWGECESACAALGVGSLREVADSPHALRRVDTIEDPVVRKRARHVVTEIERVRLVSAELSGTAPAHERFVHVGKALYRSHASLELDYEVSTPQVDAAVDAAFRAGALGARLVGGGFGGSAMALIRRDLAQRTAEQIAARFDELGYEAPHFLMA